MFRLIKVKGDSMVPRLQDGDFVFTSRFYRQLTVDQLVVVDHALYGFIVKRVLHIAPDGQLWLGGENNKSLQSERIGWVSPRRVVGKVIWCIRSSVSRSDQAHIK
ncbi:S24/S26 family peptidase [Marinomonas transparens]|uniref:S24/S26 family peptidase n=1 Tax=Marinomonas transparens TaxID=2795388 RepID=A0A934JZE2_9GAMM|nr:S24/S26 family peptidase [Marinomonas transparens]MBJ7539697.1 S24/S26 family peptidase [Marinomonas transparens]